MDVSKQACKTMRCTQAQSRISSNFMPFCFLFKLRTHKRDLDWSEGSITLRASKARNGSCRTRHGKSSPWNSC